MSYKTIEYTVYDDKIMPNTLQAGGVAGDDNAVRVKFDLNNITLAADDKVRIEISNGVGGFNSSEHLTVSGGCVYYDLPFDVTSAGGTALLHLVICSCKDNVEQAVRYSYPAKIYFEESGCGSISYKQYKQGLSGLALECKSYSDDAKAAADEAESAADEANQSATSAQSSQTAAQEAAAAAKASADSAASEIAAHNIAENAHSAKFAEINTQLSQMAPIAALSSAIGSHNTDTAAHEDIRNKIDMLQKFPYYEHTALGGAVQRFDEVSLIPHTMGVTVHGATDENGNSVTNPTVSVYGKNMHVFNYKNIRGYTFSGSNCKIVNPTQFYENPNNPSLLLPAGTYTFSCRVTGSREYANKPNFSAFFYIGETQTNIDMNNFVSGTGTFKKTFTVTEPTAFRFNNIWFIEMPTSADLSLDFQLEVGDTATEYEPYTEPQTVTMPITMVEGETVTLNTLNAISPTMTIFATDDNSLVSAVDIKYNRDIGKAIASLKMS